MHSTELVSPWSCVSPHPDGEDFIAEVRTVTFPANPNPGRVCTSFTIRNDSIGLEGNERFTVRLNFTGQESCVTIIDDDGVLQLQASKVIMLVFNSCYHFPIHIYTHSC